MEWKTVKLGDVCSILGDGIHGTPVYDTKGTYFFINGNNLDKGRIVLKEDTKKVGKSEFVKHKKDLTDRTILISINGTLGNTAKYNGEPCILGKSACYINVLPEYDRDFIYYLVTNSKFKADLERMATGTTIKNVSLKSLREYELPLPPIETQRRIAAILSSLDDKIENNNRINRNLEAQAQALFKSWFVDFEPFGGVMPEDWKKGNLLDVADLFDHKRIPLSGMQRDRMEKIYPYYGATSVMDYVDNYLYDGIYLLMGEDGSVMTDEGFPFLQYVEGKFWCNNHAHIMQGKNGYTTEMLYCLLNRTNVSGIVTGAVQGKISQASMKKIPVVLPPAKVCADMSGKLAPYFDEIRSLRQESQRLAALRDTLLPKLMRGEITL